MTLDSRFEANIYRIYYGDIKRFIVIKSDKCISVVEPMGVSHC